MGDTPTYDSGYAEEATEELSRADKKAKALRSALLETEGGIAGEEVMQTGKRSTLFGN